MPEDYARRRRIDEATQRLRQGATLAQKRLMTDGAVVFCLLFFILASWQTVGRWIGLGALLMFVPRFLTSVFAVAGFRDLWHAAGFEPRRVGRHSGHHPRPGARNRG